jgi:hypothetical protein
LSEEDRALEKDKHDTLKDKHVRFDETTQRYSKKEVRDMIWCDPLKYFEFEFSDVFVRRITYDDGKTADDSIHDPVIDKRVILKGLLVDHAPYLETGRLFAGEFRVQDVRLKIAIL